MSIARTTFLLLGAFAAGPAWACKTAPRPEIPVNAPYDAAVEVKVRALARDPEALDAWRVTGLRTKVFFGEPGQAEFDFSVSDVVSSCDVRRAVPAVGELWVLYLERSDGSWRVAGSTRLRAAPSFDPRIIDP